MMPMASVMDMPVEKGQTNTNHGAVTETGKNEIVVNLSSTRGDILHFQEAHTSF